MLEERKTLLESKFRRQSRLGITNLTSGRPSNSKGDVTLALKEQGLDAQTPQKQAKPWQTNNGTMQSAFTTEPTRWSMSMARLSRTEFQTRAPAQGLSPYLQGQTFVGSRGIGNNYFTGLIDELRVWNRPLPEAEIENNWKSGVSAGSGRGQCSQTRTQHSAPYTPTPITALTPRQTPSPFFSHLRVRL